MFSIDTIPQMFKLLMPWAPTHLHVSFWTLQWYPPYQPVWSFSLARRTQHSVVPKQFEWLNDPLAVHVSNVHQSFSDDTRPREDGSIFEHFLPMASVVHKTVLSFCGSNVEWYSLAKIFQSSPCPYSYIHHKFSMLCRLKHQKSDTFPIHIPLNPLGPRIF